MDRSIKHCEYSRTGQGRELLNGDHVTGHDSIARELQVQRWRTAVAVEVSPRLWECFDQVDPIVAVVEDVVDRWVSGPAGGMPLTGSDGFAGAYVAAVEEDAAGRPWRQLCRLDASRRPVPDESYRKRVWTYHAGWLRRLHPAMPTVVPEPLPGGVAGELVVERLRTEAAVDVAAAVAGWVGDDPARICAVVADAVNRWLALPPVQRASVALTGVDGFAQRYVAGVLYSDPADEVLRPEFCPAGVGQPVDWDAYARAVWTHHLDSLAGAR
jgi:hypothetical protein